MKLSIVVPVFNTESTLVECIESILGQSFQNIEVILVDDGSTDNSPSICDEWAQKDTRISVIHQSNKGLSCARNSGIDRAEGEYITFVDSDDTIARGTYALLMDVLLMHPEYDLLEYPVMERYGNHNRQHLLNFTSQTYCNMNTYWLEGCAYDHAYAWNKIYKNSLFESVRFPEHRFFEDVHTLPQILSKCRVVATTDKGQYYYKWNPNGITACATQKQLQDLLQAHITIWNTLYKQKDRLPRRPMRDYYTRLLNIQMDVYELSGERLILPKADYTGNYKLRLLHLIGLKKICRLNKLLHRIMKPRK